MAVQKSRKTPSKRGMHRSHAGLKRPALSVDSQTGENHTPVITSTAKTNVSSEPGEAIGPPLSSEPSDVLIKAQSAQIQLVDEHLDHPNRVVLGDVIFQRLRQQQRLPPVFTLDETPHDRPSSDRSILSENAVFTQPGPISDLPKVRLWAFIGCHG